MELIFSMLEAIGVRYLDATRAAPREAWLLQGALFGAAHLSPVLTHIAMGLAFGWLRARTESLYPSMLMHFLWNAWVVYESLTGWTLF